MKNLTSSVYTFEDLIVNDFLYVDKTEYIWSLVRPGKAMYFLSRPRRFGKSLTLATLEAVFQGKKELFKGLAIYEKEYDWKRYPIIHLNLADRRNETVEILDQSLRLALAMCASKHGVTLTADNAQDQFAELIHLVSAKGKVVILIDEYDKPILDNIGKENIGEIQEKLSNFYSVIKATEPDQRFVFLTGVSKFTHVSVFSKLNNLADLTMDERYAGMLGYTQDELERNFGEWIDSVAEQRRISRISLLQKMKEWYNGYRFHAHARTVYNPVSIAKFFENQGEFSNYWFATGTPTFLLDLLKKQQYDLTELEDCEAIAEDFSTYDVENLQILPLLLQTGYLTIKSSSQELGMTLYRLGFPNREVQISFNKRLAESYSNLDGVSVTRQVIALHRALEKHDFEKLFQGINAFFAGLPYQIHLKHEYYYQSIFHIIFAIVGENVASEIMTNSGRIDSVVETEKYVYLFEFKLDGSAEEALRQIRDQEYFRRYSVSSKPVFLAGVNFSSKDRAVSEWKIEELNG